MNIKDGKTKKEILINQAMAIPKVSMRGGFSDRNGIKPENVEIQLTNFDRRTRVQLLNLINSLYCDLYAYDYEDIYEGPPNFDLQEFIKFFLGNVFLESVNPRKLYSSSEFMENKIYSTILNNEYDDVLTLIEAIIQYWDRYLQSSKGNISIKEFRNRYKKSSIYEVVNSFFEREYVGYRFVDGIIVPISDNNEISAINDALNSEYESVYEHISKANKLLSDRKNPDYENSIKESISAVEAICVIITGAKGGEATLGKMLKKMEDHGVVIHGALKDAFDKLYGYTSNANGIRHAGNIDGPSSTFEEAKFMLVACCAFINYLTALRSD